MKLHSTKHRVSSAQIMAAMRSWPNVSAASVGRGAQAQVKASPAPKVGSGEIAAGDLRRAMTEAASRTVVVTYRKRRTIEAR